MSNRKLLFFPLLLVFYEITTYLSNDMYLPALPQIAADLNILQGQAQATLTSWFLGSISMQLILGPLSDRFGRRPIVLVGGVIFISTTILCALAPNFYTLLIARFFEGAVVCSVVTAGYASIHESFERTQAIRMLALMGSVVVLAPAFGPLFGSAVLYFANWRGIFWVIALLATIAITLLFKFMPETNPPLARKPLEVRSLAKNYWGVLSNTQFLNLTAIYCFIFCNFIVWLSAAPFIVSTEFGMNTVIFSLAQIFIFSFFVAGNRIVKKYLDVIGINNLIRTGMSISFCGALCAIISATFFPTFLMGIVLSMAAYTFGAGLVFAPLSRLAIEACSEPMGIRMALFSTGMNGAGMLGTVFSSIFYHGSLISFASILLVVISVACVIRLGTLNADLKHSTPNA